MHRKTSVLTGSRTLGLERNAFIGLLAAIVFFAASAALSFYTIQNIRDNSARVTQTHSLITALDLLLIDVQDAEAGLRGYLLTADDQYLGPYNRAMSQVENRIETLNSVATTQMRERGGPSELRAFTVSKLDTMRETLRLYREEGQAAALEFMRTDRGRSDMDGIRNTVGKLRIEAGEERTQRLQERDRSFVIAWSTGVAAGVVGLILTLIITGLLRKTALGQKREQWLKDAQLGLASAASGEQPLAQLGQNILGFLTNYLGAVAGAIYVESAGRFQRTAVHGVPPDVSLPTSFGENDSLFGHVLKDHRPIAVGELPDGYISFGSGLGQHKPRYLALAPAIVEGDVRGVFELGFLSSVSNDTLSLLEEASEIIAVAIRSAEFRTRLQALLEETQRQSEELQVQGEELRVSNEELEEQGRALREQQARLEQQQAELEQTNSQLEEQAEELERQRDNLERSKSAIEAKAKEVELASRYKSDFLANMSHELRTPLNSSLILAKLLADNSEGNLTVQQVQFAQTIQSSGNDLLNLINDILDLSKIEAGHVEIHPEAVSIERTLSGLRHMFEPLASNKGLQFNASVEADVPGGIQTDPQRLEQIIKNLLANALKFTEKGSVSLEVRRYGDSQLAFAIKDTGIGIAEEQQKRIFEAFHQADSTISRKFGGTGLGLSISRELVRLLGGHFLLESEVGVGSTFTIVIPTEFDSALVKAPHQEPAYQPQPLAAPIQAPSAAIAPAKLKAIAIIEDDRAKSADTERKLLIVEDDQPFALILRDLARELKFKALVAGTAQEALELAHQFLPNAILLDVGLPDQSGLSVLDRLKRDVRTRHIPVHVLSAEDYSDRALSLGAVGYALKPVQRDRLISMIESLGAKAEQTLRRVLIVEDNTVQREALSKLLSSHDVETVGAGTAAECIALLAEQTFDCMVLDLSLPDASGFALLETLSQEGMHSFPPVIVYTGRVLSSEEEQRLRRYSKSIIIKGAKSPERLLDEVTLFLHQVVSELPDEQQQMIRKARNRDELLEGRRILIVEDDVRNIYALTNILEPRGVLVEIARNGEEALDKLERSLNKPEDRIDLVLMDVMMPVMDGLTATRHIRKNAAWQKLPIITLTAKAMPDDQKRCIEAGANDYMAKPLDVEKLLSLVRVWMPQ
ncbi:response regulator [Aureimonas fodinaquatilis]|uniref:histidine kinase n=1 Tax=Aureimonas fodinaquatilis TaxID=2565783 RepID=A0A5B0DS75_9HYPH|nr:response regulator [Aureimonas fodinaquatilis]